MLNQPDAARLLLRLALGFMMLFHGYAKLRHGVGPIEAMLAARGLPAFFAWGVFVGEIIAPLMLIVGTQVRVAAMLVAINMVVAILLAHMNDIFALSAHGGWRLELQGFYLFTALALVLLGGGRYGLHRS